MISATEVPAITAGQQTNRRDSSHSPEGSTKVGHVIAIIYVSSSGYRTYANN